ncbi:MAG: glucosaminidase domain-containing protein, partial [Clostridia bacterium]|nr:glucosaminidase domain-containing protein [Clostridia bacterium]
AIKGYRRYGVFPSLTLAQAILESNWGRSAPGNMLFGIKWTEGCGYDSQLLWTWEYYNGEWVRVQAKFRKYDSYTDSIEDHAQLFVRLSRYKPVLEAKHYIEACEQVQKCGYATDPEYSQKLISLIEKYNLNQWDRKGYKMYNDFDKVSDWAKDAVEELKKQGILEGDPNGNFRPKKAITREELAVVINRVLKKVE